MSESAIRTYALSEAYHTRRHAQLSAELLPDGISFDTSTGTFTGTPTTPGEHHFTLSSTDGETTITKQCRIIVKPEHDFPAPPPKYPSFLSDNSHADAREFVEAKGLPATAYANRKVSPARLTYLAADHLAVWDPEPETLNTASKTNNKIRMSRKRARVARKITRQARRK